MARVPSLSTAVEASIRAAHLEPKDRAAGVMARLYAEQIDTARALATELAALTPADDDQAALIERLAKRVDGVRVVNDTGAKLTALLAALGCVPSVRGVKGGASDGAVVGGPAAVLAELRANHDARSAP